LVRVLYVSIIFVDIAIGKLTGVILTCWSHVLPTRHVSVARFGWRLLLEVVLVDEILEKFRRLEVMDSQSGEWSVTCSTRHVHFLLKFWEKCTRPIRLVPAVSVTRRQQTVWSTSRLSHLWRLGAPDLISRTCTVSGFRLLRVVRQASLSRIVVVVLI
jgi:hypothetical protein